MVKGRTLTSGQINYQDNDNKASYLCVVIKDGKFHNMSEEIRLDLIERLQKSAPIVQQPVDLEDMF
jgi:hypothetical protein